MTNVPVKYSWIVRAPVNIPQCFKKCSSLIRTHLPFYFFRHSHSNAPHMVPALVTSETWLSLWLWHHPPRGQSPVPLSGLKLLTHCHTWSYRNRWCTHSAGRLAVEEQSKRCRIISAIRDKTSFTAKSDQASQISCCHQTFCGSFIFHFLFCFHPPSFHHSAYYSTCLHSAVLPSSPFTSWLTAFLPLLSIIYFVICLSFPFLSPHVEGRRDELHGCLPAVPPGPGGEKRLVDALMSSYQSWSCSLLCLLRRLSR